MGEEDTSDTEHNKQVGEMASRFLRAREGALGWKVGSQGLTASPAPSFPPSLVGTLRSSQILKAWAGGVGGTGHTQDRDGGGKAISA